jgi:hypothetical protein
MADDLHAETAPLELDSVVEHYDDQPDECTIFRSDIPESRRLSTWITATEGGYVDLSDCR